MTKIIAFAGRKQSGKSTAAAMVQHYATTELGFDINDVRIYNIADPLKKSICMDVLGLTYEQCYGTDEDKNTLTNLRWIDMPAFGHDYYEWPQDINAEGFPSSKYMTAREVMEFVGTGLFRRMNQDVWIDSVLTKIKLEAPKIALIGDCRFGNEADKIKANEGVLIKLLRNPFNSQNITETALDPKNYDQRKFDILIFNQDLDIEHKNYSILKFLSKKNIWDYSNTQISA